ncbi:tripartite motif-containing protein 3-like [Ptychodera flava]|uniref:tripartite motif-containing protein 3-like n=1 Tax=Ptychodera flava TaxID=63121 RepID=UPI00396AA5DC
MADGLRGLLYKVSKGIISHEEKDLRGLLKNNKIPASTLEKCDSSFQIFINLEESGQISPDNLDLLKRLLTDIGQKKLAELVEEFETQHRRCQSTSQQHCQSTASSPVHAVTAEIVDKQAAKAFSAQGKGHPETIPSWNLRRIPYRSDMLLEDLKYSCPMKVNESDCIVLADSERKRLVHVEQRQGRFRMRDIIMKTITILPVDIALYGDDCFVTNRDSQRPLIKCNPNTGAVYSLGKDKLSEACGVAINARKHLVYVSDTQKHAVFIFKHSPFSYIKHFGAKGTEPGQFNAPRYLTTNSRHQVIVSDCENNRIQVFTFDGEFIFLFGGPGTEVGKFDGVGDIRVDMYDNIYACDTNNHRVQKFTGEGKFICCILTETDDIWLPVHIEIPKGSPDIVIIYDKEDLQEIKYYTRDCNVED